MSLLTVDYEKCSRDAICAATCPVKIIHVPAEGGFPEMVPDGDTFCIHCGHCVAVCPNCAMNHAYIAAEDCPPVKREWLLEPEQTEHFLRNRRSIRVYKDKPVDRETLVQLVEIARYAPSGHNRQPVSWKIVYDKEDVKLLSGYVIDWMRSLIEANSPMVKMMNLDWILMSWESGIDPIHRGAPHLIMAHAPRKEPSGHAGATIALAYLELAASGFGLGTCWSGFFTAASKFYSPLLEIIALPEGHALYGALMIGHAKFKYHRLPLRKYPEISWLKLKTS